MNKKTFYVKICLLAAVVLLLQIASAFAMKAPDRLIIQPNNGPVKSPQPSTVDMITHNVSNIVTTVDNWGLIGGYSYYGYPSGEWPRNSGHSYIAEIKYWMGAVTPSGDSLVANTNEDFEAIPNNDFEDNPYKILLSTDVSRYYDYNLSDTVGLGHGYPAYGWRIWDAEESIWDYNEVYNSLATSYAPGGPTSQQDSHYRFGDIAGGDPLMGLEIAQTMYSWNYCYNEDFMFVVMEISNTSEMDYSNFAFGLYIDIDVGGDDGHGGNGRLGDMVAFDSLENLAWTYDVDGHDDGWGFVKTGICGTKLLETPDNIGMTAFRTGSWDFLPNEDPGRLEMIASSQFDESLLPNDQYYLQCTNGIDLTAGKTIRVVYAIIAGADEEDFRANAQMAQELYDNNFIGPEPPTTPSLAVRHGSQKVYLSWDDTAEVCLDPMSGENDFVGYKLYRSDNQGKTWGIVDNKNTNNCLTIDYERIAQFYVNSPGDPIPHSFVDTGLYNGVEYWYCLAAFDRGDSALNVDALQSGFGIAGEVSNVVKVTPTPNPAGQYNAAGTVTHQYYGNSDQSVGEVIPIIFDPDELEGDDYKVVFEDFLDSRTLWHLINVTTGDTVLANQSQTNLEDYGEYDIIQGLRVVVNDGDLTPARSSQIAFGGIDTTFFMDVFYGPCLPNLTGDPVDVYGWAQYRNHYEIRYTTDSTRATWVLDGFYGYDTPIMVPYEAWNTTTNEQVSLAIYDFDQNSVWDGYDLLIIVDYPYDGTQSVTENAFPYYYGWMFGFDYTLPDHTEGDIFSLEGAPVNGPDDEFVFKADGINAAVASANLKNIRVVPNPYFGQYDPDVEVNEGESVIYFQNIPDECTIRIYSLAGDLVQTINHTSGDGAARWNLLSKNRQQIAAGIYLYHVESTYGEHLGRFAIIK